MYKIILFCLGILFGFLLIYAGRTFRIMHWPYGKLIHISGFVICITMTILLVYGLLKKKKV
ncbi:MAG: hypothetical protein ACO1N0_18330 [Fluviicola sp.]